MESEEFSKDFLKNDRIVTDIFLESFLHFFQHSFHGLIPLQEENFV